MAKPDHDMSEYGYKIGVWFGIPNFGKQIAAFLEEVGSDPNEILGGKVKVVDGQAREVSGPGGEGGMFLPKPVSLIDDKGRLVRLPEEGPKPLVKPASNALKLGMNPKELYKEQIYSLVLVLAPAVIFLVNMISSN